MRGYHTVSVPTFERLVAHRSLERLRVVPKTSGSARHRLRGNPYLRRLVASGGWQERALVTELLGDR